MPRSIRPRPISRIRSAIVFEPVVCTGTVVPAGISSSSVNDCSGGRIYVAARRRRGECEEGLRGGAGGLRLLRALAEIGEEERLVDAALEDRDAHLHALRDDFLALKACLASQLGGRQMNGHWQISLPWDVCNVLH